MPHAAGTSDPAEIARFAALADEWWRPKGKFAPLHRMNPTRVCFIRDEIATRFGRDPLTMRPLDGLSLLDVGCGGGLVAEPLARLGARVTGIDPAIENIGAAQRHAEDEGLLIMYEAVSAEAVLERGDTFDAVLLLELIEHVPSVPAFIAMASQLLKPGGVMIISTLNRTLRSLGLAIIGAEMILRWLPVGTHRWDRFVTPAEMDDAFQRAGLTPGAKNGMIYNPLNDEWRLGENLAVNYIATATKPAQAD